MKDPQTLQEAIQYFGDEQTCIDAVASIRWHDGKPTCPACGHKEHYWLKTQKRWKCKECNRQFSVKLDTIFEDSPITLDKWLVAIWMLANCKNGVSSYEIHRAIGVTQKSAWFMLHRIRLALSGEKGMKFGGRGGDPCEVDETFVGGKLKNMHKEAKVRYIKRGGAHGKTVVMGIYDRATRTVRARVIPDVKRETLQTAVLDNVKSGSTVFTDEHIGYDRLRQEFLHHVVNHTREYVRGQVHTNSIENFWSQLKRGLNGTYVAVEPYHLDRYIDEQVFRFNHRKDFSGKKKTDAERFQLALSQIGGKRLTYAEVTGKTCERPEAF